MTRIPVLLAAFTTCLLLAAPRAHAEDAEVARIMAQFADEPSIRKVQLAAIDYYNVSPDTINSLRSRAKSKALVPAVSAGFSTYRQSSSLAVDDIVYRAIGIAQFQDQNAAYTGFNVSATWNLDRLVFNAEELDVMSLIGVQDGIQREVTTLYYVRRRLQIEQVLNPPTTVSGRISAELRLEELTGLLDAYTGGFFTRSMHAGKKTSHQDE